MTHMTQNEMAELVVPTIEANIEVSWADLKNVVRTCGMLTPADYSIIENHKNPQPRWERILLNLHSNGVLVRMYPHIVKIPGGFAVTDEWLDRATS